MITRDYYRDPWALRCPECAGNAKQMTACNIVKGGVVREYECQDCDTRWLVTWPALPLSEGIEFHHSHTLADIPAEVLNGAQKG